MIILLVFCLIFLVICDIIIRIKKQNGGNEFSLVKLEKDLLEQKQLLSGLEKEKLELTKNLTKIETKYILKNDECNILSKNIEICKNENTKITEERNNFREEKNILLNELKGQEKNQEEFKRRIEEDRESYKKEQKETFENISNTIIKTQKEEIVKNHEQNLSIILNPFKENLEKFKKEIEDTKIKSVENTKVIETQISELAKKNEGIMKSADNLTKAFLGDNKKQGNYGEIQLKKILDDAGFVEGRDYLSQYNIKDSEEKDYYLDIVFNINNEKSLIIDSKLSLINYYNYVNCEVKEEAEKYLKSYRNDIKKHIKELSDKEYQKVYKSFKKAENKETLDFIFMFLPLERAYIDAINEVNNDILSYANECKISIVTASSLLSVCNMINYMWNIEKQNRNVERIVELGGELYEKFCGFTDDLFEVGKGIEKAKKMYDESIKKLTTGNGNAIKKAEELRDKLAGRVKISKKLAFIEEGQEGKEGKEIKINNSEENS